MAREAGLVQAAFPTAGGAGVDLGGKQLGGVATVGQPVAGGGVGQVIDGLIIRNSIKQALADPGQYRVSMSRSCSTASATSALSSILSDRLS